MPTNADFWFFSDFPERDLDGDRLSYDEQTLLKAAFGKRSYESYHDIGVFIRGWLEDHRERKAHGRVLPEFEVPADVGSPQYEEYNELLCRGFKEDECSPTFDEIMAARNRLFGRAQ